MGVNNLSYSKETVHSRTAPRAKPNAWARTPGIRTTNPCAHRPFARGMSQPASTVETTEVGCLPKAGRAGRASLSIDTALVRRPEAGGGGGDVEDGRREVGKPDVAATKTTASPSRARAISAALRPRRVAFRSRSQSQARARGAHGGPRVGHRLSRLSRFGWATMSGRPLRC